MEKLLIYDCEIINLIRNIKEPMNPNYSYCSHWQDYNNMGISVIGTWRNFDLITVLGKNYFIPLPLGKYEAFINYDGSIPLKNNLKNFRKFYKLYCLCDRLIGFNSISFDDILCKSNGLMVDTDFDLLCEVREAVGQPRHYVRGVTKGGYNLQNLALRNLGKGKTGSGELAPILWQEGKHQQVIDYCLNDVKLVRSLYFKFVNGLLRDPHSLKLL